jgi:tetratricopeptide (TPR) repeat protein
MKNIPIFLFATAIFGSALFVSCGSESSETSDTAKVNTPADLMALNKQIEGNPTDAGLLNKRAKYYYEHKEIEKGIADINKALSIDSSKADYFMTLSDLSFVSNQTSVSKRALEKVIKLDEKNTEAMLKLAELLLYVKKYDESISYINMALKVDKYNAKAYFMKGMNYKDLKDTMKAISSMQTAVEQDQQYYQAFMQLGLLCALTHNDLAIQYYKNAARIEPKSIEAWYDLGKYYQDKKDWGNALATYEQLLLIDPNNKNTHYNMAVIHMIGLKKLDIALEHFNKVLEVDPDFAEGYYARGMCYKEMGKKKEAKTDLENALKIMPNHEMAKAALSEIK